jgi:hypothetical protein
MRPSAAVDFDELLKLGPGRIRQATLSGTGTIDGTDESFRYLARALSLDDVPRVHRLHREILRTLPDPRLAFERDPEFFAECVSGPGCVVGAFCGERLIGYAVGSVPGLERENFGRDLDLESRDLEHVAHTAGSCVHPRYRGNGLHAPLVNLRSALLHLGGFHHQCGEVFPGNVFSIRTLFSTGHFLKGFRIDDFRFDPAGAPHFVLHRDTRSRPRRIEEPEPPEAPIHDVETYREMLAAGYWGYRVREIEGESRLCYGRFET